MAEEVAPLDEMLSVHGELLSDGAGQLVVLGHSEGVVAGEELVCQAAQGPDVDGAVVGSAG